MSVWRRRASGLPDHQERQPHLLTAQLSATLRRRLITSCRSSGGAIGDGAAAASAAAIGDGAAAGGSEPAKLTATGRWAGRRKRPAVDFAQRTSVTIHAGVTMATESAPTGVVISRGRNQPSAARASRPAAMISAYSPSRGTYMDDSWPPAPLWGFPLTPKILKPVRCQSV